ncbi:MAG: YihY/virulence factor BrkB family protein [Lachnospiraceae bacterium]|nr:YihY/virulence factor BrkB family protein [Lachnospiraceae bacterium]
MKQTFHHIYTVAKRCAKDQISVYAAQSSFFIIISAIPLVMLLVTLVQYVSPLSQADLMHAILGLVPDSLNSYVVSIVDELYHNASTAIISISAVTILWSASKGIYALELGINQVYRSKVRQQFLVRRFWAVIYTIAFIVIVLLTLTLFVFGSRIQQLLNGVFPLIGKIISLIMNLRSLLSISILTLFFGLLYKVLPDRRLNYKAQLPGALFASFGWTMFSYFYSIYIDNFANYSYIYGSLTALILLCLWIYVCMNILLIGAEINVWWSERHRQR